jgi:hypothetical protein
MEEDPAAVKDSFFMVTGSAEIVRGNSAGVRNSAKNAGMTKAADRYRYFPPIVKERVCFWIFGSGIKTLDSSLSDPNQYKTDASNP